MHNYTISILDLIVDYVSIFWGSLTIIINYPSSSTSSWMSTMSVMATTGKDVDYYKIKLGILTPKLCLRGIFTLWVGHQISCSISKQQLELMVVHDITNGEWGGQMIGLWRNDEQSSTDSIGYIREIWLKWSNTVRMKVMADPYWSLVQLIIP